MRAFCQVAQRVASADGRWRLQFPLFDAAPTLRVSRQSGSHGALQLMLEDSIGSLFDGCVLEDGQAHSTHQLPRAPVAGYYGVLASCGNAEPFASVQLGHAPDVLWVASDENACRYLQVSDTPQPLYVQVTQALWFDPATLSPSMTAVVPTPAQVLEGLQACFDSALQGDSALVHSEAQAAERNQLRVLIQNLTAERDGLSVMVADANRQAVEMQNLGAERDALLQCAVEADRLQVQLQSLTAERDALLHRAQEVDRLAVQVQNLGAERDALLQRALDADRLAVLVQNLNAERDVFSQRAAATDHLIVQLQNLDAERDALTRQVQNHIEMQQQQDQYFHQRSSEAQAQIQEALGRLSELEATNQHLKDQLHANQVRLAQLDQHMENRVGIAVNTLACLVNKK
ncbi:hypothetical protein BLL42_28205 (plasmid) [Pseudomonas frederiksbergensis]|uniref:Uncharacterized protein n=1 Tax=Pseudomonas frederiksbergensis TaxID=104087 RepID=A0A1J0ETX5_9PSED|nr:hypothetical protein [Pseudomonas frederiksbergensis]APC19597.1 hypothetical protein BLL42_28205 [Pseudomonas frederiksbergensis]